MPPIPVLLVVDEEEQPDPGESVSFIGLRDIPERLGPAVLAAAAGLSVRPGGRPLRTSSDAGIPGTAAELSRREKQVLAALSAGDPNKAIARDLGISERTVKFHLASLYRKLGVQTRTEAALEGARRGLVAL